MAKANDVYFRGIKNPKNIIDMIQEDMEMAQEIKAKDDALIESTYNAKHSLYSMKFYSLTSCRKVKDHPALSDEYWSEFEEPKLTGLEYHMACMHKNSFRN